MKYGNNPTDSIHKIMHAKATTTVHKYEPTVYDVPREGPALIKGHLEERFNGDINGEGVVETLQAGNNTNRSSSFVGIERVTGKIGEMGGTFLLQVAGTIEEKVVKCNWFVIPGSGTTQLAGLRGEGGFQANLGKGGEVHLDYWFE